MISRLLLIAKSAGQSEVPPDGVVFTERAGAHHAGSGPEVHFWEIEADYLWVAPWGLRIRPQRPPYRPDRTLAVSKEHRRFITTSNRLN